MAKNLVYAIKDQPRFDELIVFAVQQFLAIMAATIEGPTIVGNDMSASAVLFGARIGAIAGSNHSEQREDVSKKD